ncbi:MAG: DUF3618 domain-containing protein [Micrococcales bacterium]|nr:DUF3618 domain-containing protein [Micrococcales bacterium]
MTDSAKDAAADARQRLADTLDQIEDRVNIPKKVGTWSKQASDSYENNPVPFLVGAAAAALAVVGLVIWGVASRRS